MKVPSGLGRRIQHIFLAFALLTSVGFSVLILGYSWIIEDTIFNRLVAREAAFIKAHHAETGALAEPRPAFMTLHPAWETLPAPIPQLHRADPSRVEFPKGPRGTVHVLEIDLGSRVVVLSADVSAYEVSRDYLPFISLWLLAGIAVVGLLAAAAAWLAARSAVLPLRRLTDRVASLGTGDIAPGFSAGFADDEVGFLAKTIETGVVQLQSALNRESEFTRDVSHELRTPAAVLRLLADELAEAGELSSESRALFKNNVMNLDQIITTLLALAREENLAMEETALLPLLEESIINHLHLARDEAFDLQLRVPAEIKVVCNPHLAKILFDNLLTNATRYAAQPWLHIKYENTDLVFENAAPSQEPAPSQGLGHGMSLIQRVCDRFQWQLALEHQSALFRVRIGMTCLGAADGIRPRRDET